MHAIFVFSILETLPVLFSALKTRSVSLIKIAPLVLLWLSLFFTWTFQSPIYFQYKTSVIYGSIGLFMLIAPFSWLEQTLYAFAQTRADRSVIVVLCPQIAKTLFLASLMNTIAIQILSLPSWMIFKMALAAGLSGRIVMLSYPYLIQGSDRTTYHGSQEVSADVIDITCEKIDCKS